MPKLALKIVQTLQHWLVPSLLFTLSLCFAGPMLAASTAGGDGLGSWNRLGLALAAVFAAMLVSAWLLGAIARLSFRYHDRPSNGFEMWFRTPDGGLRPPAFMRRIVVALGADPSLPPRPERWWGGLLTVAFAIGCLFAFYLAITPTKALDHLSPWLIENRLIVVVAFFLTFFVLIVRRWATDQRKLLSPLTAQAAAS